MPDPSPAEELRSAASLIRKRAEAATKGPWYSFIEGRDHHGGDSFIQTSGESDLNLYLATPEYGHADEWMADQDYVASMHPLVALAVAEWLEACAEYAAECEAVGASAHRDSYALKVARAYLGTEGDAGKLEAVPGE